MSEVSTTTSVDSINPNAPVTSNLTKDGKIEADATGGPLSFDELDEVLAKKSSKKETKKEEAKEGDKKSKDLTSDTDKGKKPEPKKEAKEEIDKPEEQVKPRKTYKAKYNENEYDLDEDAVVTVKVNGQDVEVPIKELTSNYSGKTAWDKKFTELDKTRKSTLAQEAKLKQTSEMIKAIYEEKDPNIKMYKMAQIAGVDPIDFRNKFFNENINLLEKYYAMSEDERKADALAFEAQVHKHRADTLEQSQKEQQEYLSLQQKTDQLRASHQISEKEFVETHDAILEKLQLEYAKTGKADKSLLTPENIVDAILANRMYSQGLEKFKSLGLDSNPQETQKLVKLVTEARALGLPTKDMLDLIDELWGTKKAQKKIEDKKRENAEFLSGKKTVAQSTAKGSDPIFFDDI